jgi:hypothetical protein
MSSRTSITSDSGHQDLMRIYECTVVPDEDLNPATALMPNVPIYLTAWRQTISMPNGHVEKRQLSKSRRQISIH